GRREAYRQAVVDLARALDGLPDHHHHHWKRVAARLTATATATADDGPSALTLHMTALADLLDAVDPTATDPTAAAGHKPVEDRLLEHEQRYWWTNARVHGLEREPDRSTLLDALAAGMLVGADDHNRADKLLCHVPALEGQPRDRRNAVRDWIAELYPPLDTRVWGSLQPDRLAERFLGKPLVDRLDHKEDLVEPLLPAADTPAQVEQLLTVYARAAHHRAVYGRLDAPLTELCMRHPRGLALPAIAIATQVEAPGP